HCTPPESWVRPTSSSHVFGAGPSLSALKGGEGSLHAALPSSLSAPGGGEGILAEFGGQFLPDDFEHSRQVVYDIAIPEADHAIAVRGDFVGSGRLCLFL